MQLGIPLIEQPFIELEFIVEASTSVMPEIHIDNLMSVPISDSRIGKACCYTWDMVAKRDREVRFELFVCR